MSGTLQASVIKDSASATNNLNLDSSGNVGIGTSSPSANLDVTSTSTTAYSATAYNGAAARMTLRGGNATNAFNATRFTNGVNGEALFGTVQDASGYQEFVWQNYNGTYAERMRIDASGNVGIGTTSVGAGTIVDVQSTTKGVRFPNMTTTQKNAITPAAGTVVFDTTLSKLCLYTGAAWQTITSV